MSGSYRNQCFLKLHLVPAWSQVAMAMASKAKMLLRELKTVRGDLTFLRDRCAQLEEENRRLRESVVKGTRPDEDDLVRISLLSLTAMDKLCLTSSSSAVSEIYVSVAMCLDMLFVILNPTSYLIPGVDLRHNLFLQVRLQLETLLAEKQRLQQENANYARENQFLHEVVEYHQIEFNEDELSVEGPDVDFHMNDEEVDQMVTIGVPKKRN